LPNSQKIPWQRLAAEGAAIVVSILIAFAIDAWWQTRAASVALVEYLVHFENELAANDELIDAHLDDTANDLVALHRVLAAIAVSDEGVLGHSFMNDLGAALYIRTATVRITALDGLSDSGYLRLVDNLKLKKMINDYEISAEILDDVNDLASASYLEFVMPVLGDYVALSQLGWQEYDNHVSAAGENTGVTPDAPFSSDTDGLRSQRVWNALFHWKTVKIDVSNMLMRTKKQGQELRDELRQEIDRRRQ